MIRLRLVATLAALSPIVATVAHASGADAGCDKARALLAAGVVDGNQLDALIEALPKESVPVKVAARFSLGDDGIGRATDVMATAIADGCKPVVVQDAAAAMAEAQVLEKSDARFGGVRKGDDVLDRLKHKAKLWLAHFLESSGMRTYAESARVIYLGALAVIAAIVGVRVALRIARRKRVHDDEKKLADLEKKRAKEFAQWRAEAERALSLKDARAALRAGQAALLARVGELEKGVVHPARTHSEIVARLSREVAPLVEPALVAFDVAFFGKDAALDDAASFLRVVDEAAAKLGARGAA